MTVKRDPLYDLLVDFSGRADRSAGTPSEWYWREAAHAVRVKMGLCSDHAMAGVLRP